MQNNLCQLNVSQKRINIRGQNSVPQAALKPPQLSSLKLRECLSYQRTKYPFCIKDFTYRLLRNIKEVFVFKDVCAESGGKYVQ